MYELSMSPDFFIGPYDLDEHHSPETTPYPSTVYQAVMALTEEEFAEIAREVFKCDPDYLDAHAVIARVQEVNACDSLRCPIEVYLDEAGHYTLTVYDGDDV